MYKVFIIEDEHLIRDNLRKQVLMLSERYPLIYAGEAGDGEMALASIVDIQPDILLTDIKMPFMDGLTFAREARKIFPWIRIIFISGFDDFNYAKAAIQLQADEYLLKPIKSKELETTLQNTIQKLDEQKQQTTANDTNSEAFFLELKKNHFLNGLYEGKLEVSTAIKEAEEFSRNIVGKKFAVLLLSNQYNTKFEDYFHFSEYLTFLFDADEAVLFASISSRFVKFLVFDFQYADLLEKCYQIAHTLIHELEQNTQDDISVAIGPIVDRISEIPDSFHKAQDMLASYGKLRTEKIISFEDNMKDGELSPTHPFKLDLAVKIAALSPEEIEPFVQTLLLPQGPEDRTRMYRFFILTELVGLAQRKEPAASLPILETLNSIDDLTIAAASPDLPQILAELVRYLADTQIHPTMAKYQSTINQAITFIDGHFTDPDMSLNRVAAEVALSPAHFSTIFSQAVGKTFIEYLTDQRINLAKKLLRETNKKLATIAIEIGYNDPNYFSFLFKKKQNISPKEYRQQVL